MARKATSAGLASELGDLSRAVQTGEGLPAAVRAAGRALDLSLAVIDRSSAVLAVAAASPDEESKLLATDAGTGTVELRVAGAAVGELRWRPRGEAKPDEALLDLVCSLLALEIERARSGEWADEEAGGAFVRALLAREVTDRNDIVARASDLGADLTDGGGVVLARATPRAAQGDEWRKRVLALASRAARAVSAGALVAASERDADCAEVIAIVPGADEDPIERAARAIHGELEVELQGFSVIVARSRPAADAVDLHRCGQEARLAANVGEAEGTAEISFEQTGSYRLLLPAMSEAPGELEGFYSETVAPLVAYDEQYETELLATVEAYLESDGNVARTAERMYTHRHTIRYRLERAKELCGHDATSTEGREKLGLGLKAMRVLGIAPPGGPAREPGASAGKVSRKGQERD